MFNEKKLFLKEINFKDVLIQNKTYLFLSTVLQDYGDLFFKYFFHGLVACGIGDEMYDKVKKKKLKHCLFALHDIKRGKLFLKSISKLDCYVDDYPLSLDRDCKHHLTIVRIPSRFHKAYDKFIENRFSEMYTKTEIEELKLINRKDFKEIYYILTKDDAYFETFKSKVNSYFETNAEIEKENCKEYTLPLNLHQEIFYYEPRKTVRGETV